MEKSKQCGSERENKSRSFAVLKRMEWDHFTDKMRFEERPGGGEGRGKEWRQEMRAEAESW